MATNPTSSDSHPLSEKETNTDDSKFSTTTAALTDPNFPLPTLDDQATPIQHAKSFAVLIALLGTGVLGAWLFEASFLQSEQPILVLGGVFAVVLTTLFATGTVWIDWWELVLGYWWLSLPIGAAAGLVFVMNQEASSTLGEVE